MSDIPMSMKAPPVYQEGKSYEEFKRDLDIWLLLKVALAIEQGPLVYRTLTGRAKAACNDLSVAQIGSENGLQLILERLDKLYLADENQRIFVALDLFEKFKRPPSMTMSNYILEFENHHNKVKAHKCTYPDGVLAYRLIKSANLSPEHEQLCRATVETGKWTYASVVEQLKKIFSEVPVSSSQDLPIKVESTYHTSCPSPYTQDHGGFEAVESAEYELYNDPADDIQHEQHIVPRPDEYDIYYSPNYYKYNSQSKFRQPNRSGVTGSQKFYNQRRPPYQPPRGIGNQKSVNFRYQEARPPTNGEYRSLKAQYNSDPNVPNPKDGKSNYTICRRCRSIYHWISDCPHNTNADLERQNGSSSYYTKSVDDEVYIALFQSCNPPQSPDEITGLVGETFSHGVIDSGCSKTVTGENWLVDYLESLSDEEAKNIAYFDSCALFKFGDSPAVSSKKKALLPVVIGGKNIKLETEIVQSDVPLLLSKETMKAAEADIDFKTDSITLFGNKQKLICTESGHYAIPINTSCSSNDETSKVNTILLGTQLPQNPEVVAKKLHQQFSHPSARRLINLVKTSGVEDVELFKAIEHVSERCDTCKKYKKSSPRPIVTFPLATEFNETLALDLKVYENNKTYFLHMIDHATRFSAATVIKSKKAEVIINNFFRAWISIFGSPQKVISDNGGEFANVEFVDMCEKLSINFITTAAESPWSNGLCERHNGIIGEAVSKILEEVNCSVEVALCWAVNAKNSLQNIYGFSPYQLVFSKNPNLPSVLTDKLPALEGVTGSKLIAQHLNALHQARVEVIKLEASEKIRRAMKAKTRTHNNIRYLPGDEVFYKREDDNRWRGPGRVIGQDSSKVLIKIPSSYAPISVHSCRVCLTSEAQDERAYRDEAVAILPEENENPRTQDAKTNFGVAAAVSPEENEVHRDDVDDAVEEVSVNDDQQALVLDQHELPDPVALVPDQHVPPDPVALTPDQHVPPDPVALVPGQHEQPDPVGANAEVPQQINQQIPIPDQIPEHDPVSTDCILPKHNQCVKFRKADVNDWTSVKILGRAGKSGRSGKGKYRNWLNVKRLEDEKELSLDWKEVSEWKPIEHNIFLANNVFLAAIRDDKFEEARQKELKNWKIMGVYEEVEDTNQAAISVRWVYKEKLVGNQTIKKARLVARGYEEENKDILTTSPTGNKDSLRVVLSLIASLGFEINSMDIMAAFLQGKEMDRIVYLKPPKEANAKGKLWKLRRCVYGLNDASRYWYLRVREELIKCGCKCSKADPSVFYFRAQGLEGLLISHVDDFIWAGTEKFRLAVIEKMKETFRISEENASAFRYVGIEIYQDDRGIYVNQREYVNQLKELEVDPHRKKNKEHPVTDSERKELRSLIGQLSWLATQSRPDLSYGVSELGSNLKNASVKHLLKANKLIKQCKMNNISLFFPKLDLQEVQVRCYADASYGKLFDGGSQGGMLVELISKGLTSPIAWQSKRISRVVNNTMAAETLAMKDALDAGFLIKSLVGELLYDNKKDIPLEAITDSQSLHESAYSTKSMQDRRLRIDLSIIREYILNDKCTITWVPSGEQLADVLTKDGVDDSKIRAHITA